MKDKIGNEVKTGDLMMSFECCPDDKIAYITLWEAQNKDGGHGYQYDRTGKRYSFSWVYVRKSIRLDINKLPEGFLYSFRHGMRGIRSTQKDGVPEQIIEKSDWLEQKKEYEE